MNQHKLFRKQDGYNVCLNDWYNKLSASQHIVVFQLRNLANLIIPNLANLGGVKYHIIPSKFPIPNKHVLWYY